MKFANPLKRDRQVVSLKGHVVDFPGKPPGGDLVFVAVPVAVEAECIAAGLVPEDDIVEVPVATGPQRPTAPEAFQAAMFGAFDALVGEGARESFSASGLPKAEAMSKVLGWKVEFHDVQAQWPLYQSNTAEEAEAAAKEAAAAKAQAEAAAAAAKAQASVAAGEAALAAANPAAKTGKSK